MMTVRCFIGLGSNLEGPISQLRSAIDKVRDWPDTHLLGISSLYESKPMGDKSQPNYLNCVIAIDTQLAPLSILAKCQEIEVLQNRDREAQQKWQARTIDCDILLYGEECIEMTGLCIPHPGLSQRDFVLKPLADLAPNLILPNGKTIEDMISHLSVRLVVKSYTDWVKWAAVCQ